MTRLQQRLHFLGFGRWRWFRRWVGGRWERWLIDVPVCSAIWFFQDDLKTHPPPLGRGTPLIEHHRPLLPPARATYPGCGGLVQEHGFCDLCRARHKGR